MSSKKVFMGFFFIVIQKEKLKLIKVKSVFADNPFSD